jgi:hypothetical protein
MKRTFRAVQFAANIGILLLTPLVALLVIRLVVSDFAPRQTAVDPVAQKNQTPASQKAPLLNPLEKVLPLEGINWKENGKTLVLYLSTTCRYCNESIPFYQRLIDEKSDGVGKIVTLFSQGEEVATEYLDRHNIKVDVVKSGSLRSIGVTATPTLLIVDENGVVSDHWRGKLNPEKEAEVLAKLAG